MPTKQNPGVFDCYKAAMIDEPIFVILGRDPAGPATLRFWVEERARQGKVVSEEDRARLGAAIEEATEMLTWREDNLDWDGNGTPLWKTDRITNEGNPVCVMPEAEGVPSGLATLAQKVHDIRADIADFDGDKRGMYGALEEAEDALVEAALLVCPDKPSMKTRDRRAINRAEKAGLATAEEAKTIRDHIEKEGSLRGEYVDDNGMIRTTTRDLAEAPEMPDHRFAVFHKSGRYAYARGLEVAPQHLPGALDRLHTDGWELLAIFGETDSAKIGLIFKQREKKPYGTPKLEHLTGRAAIEAAQILRPPAKPELPEGVDVEIEVHVTGRDLDDARWAADHVEETLCGQFRKPTRVTILIDGQSDVAADFLSSTSGCDDWDRGNGFAI